MPIHSINDWLAKEKELGSPEPNRVVLSTATVQAVPHSRIVATREITEEGVLFFTQRGTRKVTELIGNPLASMTLWLALQQRQVILEGKIKALSQTENEHYWKTLPRDRQLRFAVYAPTSGQPIQSLIELESTLERLSRKYKNDEIPMSGSYCGFRLIPEVIYFYTLGTETFSEVIKYTRYQNEWSKELLSP